MFLRAALIGFGVAFLLVQGYKFIYPEWRL